MEAMKPNQSALSMFCANEETWVDMIPQFGLENSVTLLDGSRIGPWQAGWSTRVPLWLARHLQSKSLGKISPNGDIDNWMQVDLLKQILHHEQTNETFWMNASDDKDNDDVANVDKEDQESNTSSRPYLPERYWELSQCYSTADNSAAVSLLLQDIWTLRLNKLQSQFKKVIADDTVKAINVTGIGAAEMAVMKDVVAESLTYKVALQQQSVAGKTTGEAKTPPPRPQRQRANIRRFRGGAVPSGGSAD